MKKIILLFTFIISITSFAQEKLITKQHKGKEYIEVIGDLSESKDTIRPDYYAMYPNGKEGMINDIIKNFKYPRKAKKKGISGKVIIQFHIGKLGDVEDISILKSVSPELDSRKSKWRIL